MNSEARECDLAWERYMDSNRKGGIPDDPVLAMPIEEARWHFLCGWDAYTRSKSFAEVAYKAVKYDNLVAHLKDAVKS